MTQPHVPAPVPPDWQSIPTFCSRCQIHQATNHKPICPVCLDDIRREVTA
jgi:predicted amidophosphoribosyltransferase